MFPRSAEHSFPRIVSIRAPRVSRGAMMFTMKGKTMLSRTSISALALVLASAGTAAAFPATATSDVNVRSGPGVDFSVVDQLRAGDTVEVTSSDGGWYQLASGGWTSGNYLDAGADDGMAVDGSAAVEGYEPGYVAAEAYPSDYGSPVFYVDADPYFWDDAGFYFSLSGGEPVRVRDDFWQERDYRDLRWTDARYRMDFERRMGGYEGRASSYGPPPADWERRRDDDDDRIIPRILND